jgi:hypothetical protein
MDTNFGGFCANRSRGSISNSNLRPVFIDFEDSRDMFFLRPPVVSGGGRSGSLKRRSSGETRPIATILNKMGYFSDPYDVKLLAERVNALVAHRNRIE